MHESREEVIGHEVRQRLHLLIAQLEPYLCLPFHAGSPGLEIRDPRLAAIIADLGKPAVAADQDSGVGVEGFLDHALANRFWDLGTSVKESSDLRTHRLLIVARRVEKGRQLSLALALGLEPQRAGGRVRHGSRVSAAIPPDQQAEVRDIGDSQLQGGCLFGAIDPQVVCLEFI